MAIKTSAVDTDQLRTAVRFPLHLPLRLKTADGTVDAMTDDVSANGILFTGEHLPGVDTRIEFTMKMPAKVMGTSSDVSIHCIGRVVRHNKEAGGEQAAAIIDEYFLRA